jgi:hypothetical protein
MAISRQLSGYNFDGMSLFESFTFLNRSRDERELENHSARSLFIWLLVLLFVSGANASLLLYQVIRLHRFPWSEGALLVSLGLLVFRLARIVYNQLGR